MKFKFRDRVRVLYHGGVILSPDGSANQGEFFEGVPGYIIRYDPQKDGYLVLIDCPELKEIMGEFITASFRESELELVELRPQATPVTPRAPKLKTPAQAKPGPHEY